MVDNSNKFAGKFKLKSSRLKNWDYSTPGFYLITICTYNHNNFFGKIIDNKMELSKRGEIVKSELLKTFEIRKNIKLHEWVVMPNHVHILMEIKYRIDNIVETPRMASLLNQSNNLNPNNNQNTKLKQNNNLNQSEFNYVETPCMASLQSKDKHKILNKKSNQLISKTIQQFKSAVTRQINPQTIFFAWQSRFHDQIIKDEKELLMIKNYIINNPINWQKDKFFNLIKVKK